MRRALLALGFSLAALVSSGTASADVPNPGSKCKCEAPGIPVDGSIAASMLGAGGVLLLVSRSRRRTR